MKKVTTILIVSLLVTLITSTAAFAKELNYWYSDGYQIGKVANRNVWSYNYSDGLSDSDFLTYLNHAMTQWSDASISTWHENESSSSTIWVYSGDRDTLENLEPGLKNLSAVTVPKDYQQDGSHTYQGVTKYNYKIKKIHVYVPKQPFYYFWGDNNYKHAFTHEFGHALGWFNHSTDKNDVMHKDPSSKITLTNRDKNHLSQNY